MKSNCLQLILVLLTGIVTAEEGMWPLSELGKLDLASQGLEISPTELYNSEGVSLIDGICKVGGCSGSFVSDKGLILTNHHCAYRAIQSASTPDHDYLQAGFLARTMAAEIPAEGYEVRITTAYWDVSDEVLGVVLPEMTPAERNQAVDEKINAIVARVDAENPGMRSEVAEMFSGKTYVLFLYTYLKDVRLVYAPPRSIGNYGGEIDNWTWPRHAGDFSFMRVYVAPDGSPAEYAPENVPYQPKRVIEIAPQGVDDEDYVFILGYPGRTYRHRTSFHLQYQYEVSMPWTADLYAWQIATLEDLGANDRAVALKLASRIKGRSNTMKNYRGKLLGIRRLDLLEQRRRMEKELQEFIIADPERRQKYGTVLDEIDAIYQDLNRRAAYELVMSKLTSTSPVLDAAFTVYESAVERQKPDDERKSKYTDRNLERTLDKAIQYIDDFHSPADLLLLTDIFQRALSLPEEYQLQALVDRMGKSALVESVEAWLVEALNKTRLNNPDHVRELTHKSQIDLEESDDPLMKLAVDLYPVYKELDDIQDTRSGELDRLHARLIDGKKEFLQEDFVPDANGTLRLTFGHIRGYSPADAVYCDPQTTLDGVIQKNNGVAPFNLPQRVVDLYQAKDFGRYTHPRLKSVPVCLLYNMDTTGGNSGSVILNAQGQLVGVNFDRAYEATINDYAWNESYSRSIGVDIRYVLWIAEKYSGATELLSELNMSR